MNLRSILFLLVLFGLLYGMYLAIQIAYEPLHPTWLPTKYWSA